MARGWKRAVEWAAVSLRVPAVRRRLMSPSGVVLAYHNIVPSGESPAGALSLHVDQRTFGDQLDLLAETHEIVALEDLIAGNAERTGRARAAVTFDDAYLGALTAGLDELAKRKMPATIFVPPGILGEACWWDLLSAVPGESLAPDVRRQAIGELRGKQAAILDWAVRVGLPTASVPEHARLASETDLLARASSSSVTLGAHTWTHPNLASLSPEECADEIRRSVEWLRDRAPRSCRWLAYPYGLWSEAVVEEARTLVDGALLVGGGIAVVRGRARATAFVTPRLNVPRGLTLDGLRLRLAGLHRS